MTDRAQFAREIAEEVIHSLPTARTFCEADYEEAAEIIEIAFKAVEDKLYRELEQHGPDLLRERIHSAIAKGEGG